jgi:hypothetical protein
MYFASILVRHMILPLRKLQDSFFGLKWISKISFLFIHVTVHVVKLIIIFVIDYNWFTMIRIYLCTHLSCSAFISSDFVVIKWAALNVLIFCNCKKRLHHVFLNRWFILRMKKHLSIPGSYHTLSWGGLKRQFLIIWSWNIEVKWFIFKFIFLLLFLFRSVKSLHLYIVK